jgi:hypothetical protein
VYLVMKPRSRGLFKERVLREARGGSRLRVGWTRPRNLRFADHRLAPAYTRPMTEGERFIRNPEERRIAKVRCGRAVSRICPLRQPPRGPLDALLGFILPALGRRDLLTLPDHNVVLSGHREWQSWARLD